MAGPPLLCPIGMAWLVVAEHAIRFSRALVKELKHQLEVAQRAPSHTRRAELCDRQKIRSICRVPRLRRRARVPGKRTALRRVRQKAKITCKAKEGSVMSVAGLTGLASGGLGLPRRGLASYSAGRPRHRRPAAGRRAGLPGNGGGRSRRLSGAGCTATSPAITPPKPSRLGRRKPM